MKNGGADMKVFLRVVVTILILCGLGFGTYFIFFKPADDDVVFLKLSQMMEYKDYQGNSYSTNRRVGEKIGIIRTGRRVAADVDPYGGSKVYYEYLDDNGNTGCVEIDNELTNVYNYYFAYTQASKKVKKSVQNDMQKAIDTYLKAYDELNEKLNMVISLQDVINELLDERTSLQAELKKTGISEENTNAIDTQIEKLKTEINSYAQELSDRYLLALNKYRACLKDYTDLILKVKDFVITYVFDGEPATDKDVVKNDIYLYVVQNAMNEKVGEGLSNIESFSNIDMSSVKVAQAGLIIYGSAVIEPKYVIKETSNESVKVFDTPSGKYYRKDSDGYYYECDKNYDFIYSGSDRGASFAELQEDRYLGSEYDNNGLLLDLRSSKLVEHYNFILDGGYLDSLKLALSSDNKAEFMSKSATISKIPKVCVNSIRYILACYGFCG